MCSFSFTLRDVERNAIHIHDLICKGSYLNSLIKRNLDTELNYTNSHLID